MQFMNTVEKLNSLIYQYGTRMLARHINHGQNDLEPLKNTYSNTIFNSMEITNHAVAYKIFNNVAVWLIDNISDEMYLESINDYLKTNNSEHGVKVYDSYTTHKDYFENEYFGDERKNLVNKQGLLFIMTEKTEKGEIVKICYFLPTDFND